VDVARRDCTAFGFCYRSESREPEVGQFESTVNKEYIIWLDICMPSDRVSILLDPNAALRRTHCIGAANLSIATHQGDGLRGLQQQSQRASPSRK
jgi:hypothetical protein